MTIYFIVVFILILIAYVFDHQLYSRDKLFLIFSFIVLLFLYSFRSATVGWDTQSYLNIFMNISSKQALHSYLEAGWIIYNKILYTISPTQHMFFFGVGILGMGAYYIGMINMSYDKKLSVILYVMFCCWFNLMNQERTQIAVGICMFSFLALIKKKYVLSIVIVFIASLFHSASYVFLLFILFDVIVKKYNWKTIGVFSLAVGIVFIFYDKLYSFITKYYFTAYTIDSGLVRHTKGGNLKMFSIFMLLSIIIFYLDKKRIDREGDKSILSESDGKIYYEMRKRKLLNTAVLFSLALQLISVNNTMISRFSNFFSIYYTILIPNVLYQMSNNRLRKQYKGLFILIMIVYMVISLAFSENGYGRDGVIPYIIDWI